MTKNTKDIILFSTADWDNPFWTNKQHTAKQLSELGYNVLYIESLGLRTPHLKLNDIVRIKNRLKKFFNGTRKINPHLWVYSPLVIPLHRFLLVRLINKWILIFHLKLIILKLGFKNSIIWTYNPMIVDLIPSIPHSSLIYHSVDDLSASPGIDSKLILKSESELLKLADHVFCTSRKIERHCRTLAKGEVHYFNNVVDYEHFSKALNDLLEPEDIKNIPHPRLGFIGAISEYKVDFNLIKSVAIKNPNWHWVLIGKIGEGQPQTSVDDLANIKNIHILGPKSYEILPSYIRHFDIATIPCPKNQYTESMFPMKFFEYMAAGKPIIVRDIDSLLEFKNNYYSYSSEEVHCLT
jgi:glycosyltransferase involved in cell wall biosynthesis